MKDNEVKKVYEWHTYTKTTYEVEDNKGYKERLASIPEWLNKSWKFFRLKERNKIGSKICFTYVKE